MTHWKRPWCWERLRAGREGETEDEMVGWYHQLNRHEFEQALGDGEGQGSLVCCSPWGCKESDTTEHWTTTTTIVGLGKGILLNSFWGIINRCTWYKIQDTREQRGKNLPLIKAPTHKFTLPIGIHCCHLLIHSPRGTSHIQEHTWIDKSIPLCWDIFVFFSLW